MVARGVYRQETWSSCRCSRLAMLSFDGELAGRIRPHQIPKLVRIKAAVLRLGLRLGQHVRVGQYAWSGQLVWRSLVRDVGQGVVCDRRL